jgi:hypothetical protein
MPKFILGTQEPNSQEIHQKGEFDTLEAAAGSVPDAKGFTQVRPAIWRSRSGYDQVAYYWITEAE